MEQNSTRWLVILASVFSLGLVVGLGLGSSWLSPTSIEERMRHIVPLFTLCTSGMFGLLFTVEVQGRVPLEVRSHWGGLGGGIGGLSISPAILQLFLAIFFGGLTIVQLGREEGVRPAATTPAAGSAPAPSSTPPTTSFPGLPPGMTSGS